MNDSEGRASGAVTRLRRFARRIRADLANSSTERKLAKVPPAPEPGQFDGAVLIYTPEAELSPHLALMAMIGRSLVESGQPVVFARCFETFKRCPPMDNNMLGFPAPEPERHNVCVRCGTYSLEMLGRYNLPTLDLRSYLTQEIKDKVAAELAGLPNLLRTYEYDGIGFGKLTAMDLALSRKVSDFDGVTPENRIAWWNLLEGALISYLLASAIMDKTRFKSILHYNDYSLLLAARLAARNHGVPGYTVTHVSHNNIDRRKAYIRPAIGMLAWRDNRLAWPSWRNLCLPPDRARAVGDDILSRFKSKGTHQFSPAKSIQQTDLRDKLEIDHGMKIIAAFTSSLDELIASMMNVEGSGGAFDLPQQPFESQMDWLDALVEHVGSRDDRVLVIRIHPREGAFGRRKIVSDNLARLHARFDQPTKNCRIIWPEDPTSSYDLAEIADLGLIGWSTIGLELARLGIPVLSSTQGIGAFPREDFMEWGATAEEYFQQLDFQLTRPTKLESVIHAFRWYNLNHLGPSIDLSDMVPDADYMTLPPYNRLKDSDKILAVVTGQQSLLDINRHCLEASQTSESAMIETAAVRRELRRIIHFLFTGANTDGDEQLTVIQSANSTAESAGANGNSLPETERTLIIEGDTVRYRAGDHSSSRYSPMVRRLALLCGTREEAQQR